MQIYSGFVVGDEVERILQRGFRGDFTAHLTHSLQNGSERPVREVTERKSRPLVRDVLVSSRGFYSHLMNFRMLPT